MEGEKSPNPAAASEKLQLHKTDDMCKRELQAAGHPLSCKGPTALSDGFCLTSLGSVAGIIDEPQDTSAS